MCKLLSKNLALLVIILHMAFATKGQDLTLQQQEEDFTIFRGSLKEGHGGLFYFIDEASFNKKCDSVRRTFREGASTESFYLKLRYLTSLLGHGHTRINFPDSSGTNFKMGALRKGQVYLPLQLLVINKRLYVTADCSDERLAEKGSEILSINGVPVARLLQTMLQYIPADGRNTSFKYYFLYNYYYFHFLYNLLFPGVTEFDVLLAKGKKPVRLKGKKPAEIENTYLSRTGQNISRFDDPLDYKPEIGTGTAYLKVSSFYKGFIESFGKQFEPYMDSVFRDLNRCGTANLVIDLRNNEGGGDSYTDILFSHLSTKPFMGFGFDQVPGKVFQYSKYTINLSDELKAFINDPNAFLNDGSLVLKPEYTKDKVLFQPAKNVFDGRVYVLTNGGTFSAGNIFVRHLYNYRKSNSKPILFIGEENGGDIY
ncbi:MAG TPA: S41 family peptidase, partial [Flavisolibacter sp.]|nr:S41 family peptidase [Flavisolibacter sp.]